MWEIIYNAPIEEASEEQLLEEYNRPCDGYIQNWLHMEALNELLNREIVEDPSEKN